MPLGSEMADLHRQSQDYSKQGKASRPAAAEPSLGAKAAEEPEAGAWLGSRVSRWPWAQSAAEPPPAGLRCLPSVTRGQRSVAGGSCSSSAALCFGSAALYAPVSSSRARKFALLWSSGSVSAWASAASSRGGPACGRSSRGEETPSRSTLGYAAALGATLYAASVSRSTVSTALGACAQVAASLYALIGLSPWGGVTASRSALGRLNRGTGLANALPV